MYYYYLKTKTWLRNNLYYFPRERFKAEQKKENDFNSMFFNRFKNDSKFRDLIYKNVAEEVSKDDLRVKMGFRDISVMKLIIKKELMDRFGKCEKCGALPTLERPLTLDHIVPIFLIIDMGLHYKYHFDKENIRLLCVDCNTQKSNHLDFTHPMTKVILLRYLSMVPDKKIEPEVKAQASIAERVVAGLHAVKNELYSKDLSVLMKDYYERNS